MEAEHEKVEVVRLRASCGANAIADARLLVTRTLGSIWETLHERQKIVLQTMAETVRPETVQSVGDYLSGRINFNQVNRAIKALRDINLIVVNISASLSNITQLFQLKTLGTLIIAICVA